MDQDNRTDQFFRENLDQIEFQPSEQTWEKVQGAIHKKSVTPWSTYLKIAAGFVLLLAVGILFYEKEEQQIYASEEVISPQPLEIAAIEVESLNELEEEVVVPAVKTSKEVSKRVPAQDPVIQRAPEKRALQLTTIDKLSLASIEATKPKLSGVAEPSPVKITYFTARSSDAPVIIEEKDTVKTKLIDRMKYFAQNVSPVDLLTDLRMAKEELLENGFRKN